jgi:hypothetical protein
MADGLITGNQVGIVVVSVGESNPRQSGDRGQSETVGLALIIVLVVVGTGGVAVLGATALDDVTQSVEIERAELTMSQFDSRASRVALGSSPAQSVALPDGMQGGVHVAEDAGHMTVSIVDRGGGKPDVTLLDETNGTLGAVVYEYDDATVAYQGGGVWRRSANGSTMASPPEFHYRRGSANSPTLTLPVVQVSGSGTPGDRLTARASGGIEVYPNETLSNPLDSGNVEIRVKSDYYRGWGDYFAQRTDATVRYDHGTDVAIVTLFTPDTRPAVAGAIVSGATNLQLKRDQTVDSYDSDSGAYPSSEAADGSVYVPGTVTMKRDGVIEGSLVAGGDVTLKSGATVTSDVRTAGSVDNRGATVQGSTDEIASVTVPEPAPAGDLIDEQIDATNDLANTDNGAEDDISGTALDVSGTATLGPGTYRVDDIALDRGETLVLDARSGDIDVVVEGGITLRRDAEIRVRDGGGANDVQVYVDGGSGDVQIKRDAAVEVDGDRAPSFWMYMRPENSVQLKRGVVFQGVLYGPGDSDAGASIQTKRNVDVYGALVGDISQVKRSASLHYDSALADSELIPDTGGSGPPVTYLHVSTNEVVVGDD